LLLGFAAGSSFGPSVRSLSAAAASDRPAGSSGALSVVWYCIGYVVHQSWVRTLGAVYDRPRRRKSRLSAVIDRRYSSRRGRRSRNSGVERVSQRHVPRVSGQRRPTLARHVGVTDARLRIGKAKRAAGSRRPERTGATERPGELGFMKPSENCTPSPFMHSS
jgi:hypothetical protein